MKRQVEEMKKIMLIPLDNRPCCSIFPEKIGSIAGCSILQPPSEMLGDFLIPGKCDRIGEWMLEHAVSVDGFVVSCDMLSYGGLIASRDVATAYDEAIARLEVLKELRSRYPKKPVYAQNILMRISITVRNSEYERYWKDIASYSVLSDKIERLGMNELKDELHKIEERIPCEILETYFRARERNHKVNLELISWVKQGIIDFLIITQEDCAAFGPHIKEQKALMKSIFHSKIAERTIIYPGADEGTQTLIMRMLLSFNNIRPAFYQVAGDINGMNVISEFEDRPIGETLKCHISAVGGVIVEDIDDADVALMVNTPVYPDGEKAAAQKGMYLNPRHNLWSFIEKLDYFIYRKGIPVCLIDVAFCNCSDSELVDYLFRAVDAVKLYSYAGWNTCGNTMGTAVAMACARLCLERHGNAGQLQAFVEFLLERFLDEWAYQANVREDLYWYIATDLKVSPINLENKHGEASRKLTELAAPYVKRIKEIFLGRPIESGAGKYIIRDVNASFELPWNRAFECKVSVSVALEQPDARDSLDM